MRPADNAEREHARALAVVERYFDVDIQTADDAFCVLVDNGIDPQVAAALAHDMYQETDDDGEA